MSTKKYCICTGYNNTCIAKKHLCICLKGFTDGINFANKFNLNGRCACLWKCYADKQDHICICENILCYLDLPEKICLSTKHQCICNILEKTPTDDIYCGYMYCRRTKHQCSCFINGLKYCRSVGSHIDILKTEPENIF